MIIIKLMGGLGNQMFQYAFGYTQAKRLNTDLFADLRFFSQRLDDVTKRSYELDCFKINLKVIPNKILQRVMFPVGGTRSILNNKLKRLLYFGSIIEYKKELKFKYSENNIGKSSSVYYEGYWQSEKYFLEHREDLLDKFKLKNELYNETRKYKDLIKNSNSVSIHIRRGDYVNNPTANAFHGLCSKKYYDEAIEYFDSRNTEIHYFVFSDDLEWAKENIESQYVTFVDLPSDVPDVEEMLLMSLCKHNIIANSSFSWWGAWLNNNNDKVVVAPKQWFADEEINTSDLIPERWLRL